jgi:DNA-binding transcriptional MocR family regulator
MRWVSHILQHTVAHLWADRDTLRLLDHASTVYASRRQALVDALRGHDVTATGVSGLNVWVSVPQEAVALRELWGAGWAVAAGEPYRLKTAPALRVTTATLEPTEAEALAEVLTASLTPSSRTSPA